MNKIFFAFFIKQKTNIHTIKLQKFQRQQLTEVNRFIQYFSKKAKIELLNYFNMHSGERFKRFLFIL